MRRLAALAAAPLLAAGCGGEEHTVPQLPQGPPLELVEVARELTSPVQVVAAPGERDRVYIVEQNGRVRVLVASQLGSEAFLDIRDRVTFAGEQGLLGLAFHPDYEDNRRLFVHYSNREGDTRIVEYRADGERVLADSARILLEVEQPYDNHNGGQLAFGPDGLLYLGLGDGGKARDPEGRAQNPDSLLGKLLRRNVDEPGGQWEIVAVGLRNPWRFSFDPPTGRLFIADVGQEEWEEIDVVPTPKGEVLNFGWDAFEGLERFEDKDTAPGTTLVEPVAVYSHAEGCSITGGFLYRGDEVPSLRGRYVYGDYCAGTIWSLRVENGRAIDRRIERVNVPQLTSFGLDARGNLYVASQPGRVYRLAAP